MSCCNLSVTILGQCFHLEVLFHFVSPSLVTDFDSGYLVAVCVTALCCGRPSGVEDSCRSISGDRSGGAHCPNEHYSQE